MKTYFITGVNGFIGIHWAKDLLSKGNTVLGIDNNSENIDLIKNYKKFFFFKGNILKYKKLKNLISRSDFIIHLASIAEPLKYMNKTKEVIDVTAIASINIINLCSKLNKTMFFTSTSEVYGKIHLYHLERKMIGSLDLHQLKDGVIVHLKLLLSTI